MDEEEEERKEGREGGRKERTGETRDSLTEVREQYSFSKTVFLIFQIQFEIACDSIRKP